ncbi:hypothetical protein Pfo_013876 [Paulownia fortunei]|nr:hypothetical protein Pfo_013876 [Paulownia fortunei]
MEQLREGSLVACLTLLSGSNYSYWKTKMRAFFKSLNERAWKSILAGWKHTTKTVEEKEVRKPKTKWSTAEDQVANFNSNALNAIFSAVDENQFKLIFTCESTKKAWEVLQIAYEGTKTIRMSKLQILTTRFENLRMEENKIIIEFNINLCDISNEAHALREKYTDFKLVRKVLRSLPERFAYKVTDIEETRHFTELRLDELMGALQFFEMKNQNKREKNKGIALHASRITNSQKSEANVSNFRKNGRIQCRECSECSQEEHEEHVINHVALTSITLKNKKQRETLDATKDIVRNVATSHMYELIISPSEVYSDENSDDEGPSIENIQHKYQEMFENWLKVCKTNEGFVKQIAILIKEKETLKGDMIRFELLASNKTYELDRVFPACHFCRIPEHIRSNLLQHPIKNTPKIKIDLKNTSKRRIWIRKIDLACHVAHTSLKANIIESWYFDSRCFRHMTNGGRVTFGDRFKGQILGKGTLNMEGLPILKNMLHIEGLKANLISISQLCDQNLLVKFNKDSRQVFDDSNKCNTRASCYSLDQYILIFFKNLERSHQAKFRNHPTDQVIGGISNADWAGDVEDKKNTTGGCFYLGNNLIS